MAHLIAGPACGMYLADMGADVIKVENPGSGDASRTAYARHLNGERAVLMAVTGEPDGTPILTGAPVVDTIGALLAGQGIVTALLHRERTGQGQRVDVCLLDGLMLAHAARLSIFLATGEEPGRHGSAHPYLSPFQAFAARDGWIYVAAWLDRPWAPFCAAIERPDLAKDERFTTNESRVRHRAALNAILTPIF